MKRAIILLGCAWIFLSPLGATADTGGLDSCRVFLKTLHRFLDGYANFADMKHETREVYRAAEQSGDPVLRDKAGALVRASGSPKELGWAINDFAAYCRTIIGEEGRRVEIRSLPPRESRPIPQSENERQLRAILNQSGIGGAKCEQKQYGGGWVTICDR